MYIFPIGPYSVAEDERSCCVCAARMRKTDQFLIGKSCCRTWVQSSSLGPVVEFRSSFKMGTEKDWNTFSSFGCRLTTEVLKTDFLHQGSTFWRSDMLVGCVDVLHLCMRL